MKTRKNYFLKCLTLTGFLSLAGLTYNPITNFMEFGIESYAAVGDVATSDIQEEINGVKYPADGATITNTWKMNNVYINVYSDNTIVVSGTGSTHVNLDFASSELPPWKTTPVHTVLIKEGVTGMPAYSFYNQKSLVRVKLPNTFTEIRARVFSYCIALAEIEIPSNITYISSEAFTSSKEGMNVIVHCGPNNAPSRYFPAKADITYTFKGFDVINQSTLVGVYGDIANAETLEIPGIIDGKTITDINMSVNWCPTPLNVKSLKIPTGMKITTLNTTSKLESIELSGDPSGNASSIGTIRFRGDSNGINLKFDSNVTNISGAVITTGKNYIKSVEAPNVRSIGDYSFRDCSNLENVQLPSSLESIGTSAFQGCTKLSEMAFPSSLESIGTSAFQGCTSLSNVDIGSITAIPDKLFSMCTSLTIPDLSNVTDIGSYAFSNCKTSSDNLELNNIKTIGDGAFSTTGIKDLTLSTDENPTISTKAFLGLTTLKTLKVSGYQFNQDVSTCTALEKIYILDGISPTYNKTGLPSTAMVYCVAGSTAETWCKNNSVAYKLLSDEEIEDIVNGKRPTVIENSVIFDRQAPEDKTFTYNLGEGKLGAKSIKSISINGNKIAFSNTDSEFTFSKDILLTIPSGTHNIIVEFDNGYVIANKLSITIVGSEVILPPELTVPEQNVVLEKENLIDISFKVYCETIDSIIINNKLLKSEEYTLIDGFNKSRIGGNVNNPKTLTIKKEVFEGLKPSEYQIIIITDGVTIKDKLSVFITGDNEDSGNTEKPDILDTIKYEFYKDYPDYLIIPFNLNRATKITKIEIENNILTSSDYEINKNTIIISKDYLSTLDIGKYRISITFDDGTVRSNAQLIVYNEAADRAAPYLLQSRIVFNGSPIVLAYDPGKGDLETTNVLALVLDNEIILPNGNKLPFTSNNINNIQRAFIDIDEEIIEKATSSNTTKSESIEIEIPQVEEDIFNKDVVLDNENELIDDNFNIDSEDSDLEIIDSDKETETLDKENIITEEKENDKKDVIEENEPTEDETEKETIESKKITQINKEEDIEIKTNIGLADSFTMLYNDSVDYNKVFTVDGTQITLDGDYITSLNLNDGDHLIGAIFNNTERTTDVKKVILTIESETPVVPPVTEPEEPSKPSGGDSSSSGGSSSGGGGGSGGGNSSKPSEPNKPISPSLPDGSINPDYKPNIPDSGGSFEGNGDDWVYVKPDGSHANNEWVSDGKDWYYIDGNSKLKYDWAYINNEWYMLNRDHDGKFGAAKFGWYHEKQDNKWYFLNPMDTKMLTGWQKIKGEWYYLNINTGEPTYVGDNKTGWTYTNKENKPHGAMYSNEITPDGYKTDETGKWAK